MRKNLLAIGALALVFSANAQILTYVGDGATVTVTPGSQVASGGGIESRGNIDNYGNIIMQGGQFKTANSDGSNFHNKIWDGQAVNVDEWYQLNTPSFYGQFYIGGNTQEEITGTVTQESWPILDATDARKQYAKLSLPFYNKVLSSLNKDLGITLTDTRWSNTEVLVNNSRFVRTDNVPLSATTTATGTNNKGLPFVTKATADYIIGNASNKFAGNINYIENDTIVERTTDNKLSFTGVPYAENISETLVDSGNGVNYGTNGNNLNAYREKYKSYVYDVFSTSYTTTDETRFSDPNYGKNLYIMGNPYLTNLDLSQIMVDDASGSGDGNNITNILGISTEFTGATWDKSSGGFGELGYFTTYVTGYNGQDGSSDPMALGDQLPVIAPMRTFGIKLTDNTPQTLLFEKLRRFASFGRFITTPYQVGAAKSANKTTSFVKELTVIALDADKKEVGRTYYAVYPTGITGVSTVPRAQVLATSANVIGTFEEAKTGGIDQDVSKSYWLYINTANDNDFKGKEIAARIYSDAVKYIKVQIKEDAKMISNRQSVLTNGESFYISQDSEEPVKVSNGDIIPVTSKSLGLYYGKSVGGNGGTLSTSSEVVKPSTTFVVYEDSSANYLIVFDKTWKKANIQVYDLSGKLIHSANNVSTSQYYSLGMLPRISGAYVVTAMSETGQKFSQKIKF